MSNSAMLTPEIAAVVRHAHQIALAKHHAQIEVEHILLALLAEPDGLGGRIVTAVGADPQQLARHLDAELRPSPQLALDWTGTLHLTPRCERVLMQAAEAAARQGSGAGLVHLLPALADVRSGPARELLH